MVIEKNVECSREVNEKYRNFSDKLYHYSRKHEAKCDETLRTIMSRVIIKVFRKTDSKFIFTLYEELHKISMCTESKFIYNTILAMSKFMFVFESIFVLNIEIFNHYLKNYFWHFFIKRLYNRNKIVILWVESSIYLYVY